MWIEPDRWAKSLGLIASIIFCLSVWNTASALENVKIHISGGTTVNSLIFRIGEDQGFYKQEGLQVLSITATALAGIQGLLAGSFDFSQILGQSSGAIMSGAPLKILMVFDTRPLFWLYGSKKINTLQDLKGGKYVGVNSLGGNTGMMTRELLSKKGIDPRRDVVMLQAGTSSVRLAALISGALDAGILNPSERNVAKKNGLHELLFYGDDLETVAGGVATTDKTLSERPDLVRRFLRGTLKAYYWFRTNEKDAVAKMVEVFKVSQEEAIEIYKATLKVFTKDGTTPLDFQERIISFQKKQLDIAGDVPPGIVYNFSILRSVIQELGKGGS